MINNFNKKLIFYLKHLVAFSKVEVVLVFNNNNRI